MFFRRSSFRLAVDLMKHMIHQLPIQQCFTILLEVGVENLAATENTQNDFSNFDDTSEHKLQVDRRYTIHIA